MWNVLLTSQYLPPWLMMVGSGAKPGMIGLTVLLMALLGPPPPPPLAMVEGVVMGVSLMCDGGGPPLFVSSWGCMPLGLWYIDGSRY